MIQVSNSIDAAEASALNQARLLERAGAFGGASKTLGSLRHTGLGKRQREGIDDAHGLEPGRLAGGAGGADGVLHGAGAHLDFEVIDGRAGDGHHQRGRVAEIALELDAGGALGQAWTKRLEFQIDIAELLAAIFGVFGELYVDEGCAGEGDGADAIGIGAGGVDGFVLRDGLLDRASDELLHLLRGGPRPLAGGDGDADRDLRIFALRHGEVAEGSPGDDGEERGPCDLAMFDEEARGVVGVLDELVVGSVCHGGPLGEYPDFLPGAD